MNLAPLSVAASLLLPVVALAGPLQEARVNQIVNDVKVVDPQKGARPAVLQDTVRDQIGVRTGIQSRAELLFQDATLTRLGAETFFSFKAGTRDLSLERGTMLLQVPKNRGGARIRTASVTASITGTTIMIESLPKKHVKVLVLEGSLRLSANGRFGESISLKPGKMIIMEANAKRLPNPVDVDLRKVVKTSALVDPQLFKGKSRVNVAPLPSLALIEKEISLQSQRLGEKQLISTNLVIAGNGTEVTAATEEAIATLEDRALRSATPTAELAATTAVANADPERSKTRGMRNDALPNGSAPAPVFATAANVTDRMFATATTLANTPAPGGSESAQSDRASLTTIFASSMGSNAADDSSMSAARTSGSGTSGNGTSGSGSGTGGAAPVVNMTSGSDLVVPRFSLLTGLLGGSISATGALIPSGGTVTGSQPWTITANSITAGNGMRFVGTDGTATVDPHAGGYIALLYAPELRFSPTGINGAVLTGGNAFAGEGGNGGALLMGSALTPIPRDVTIAAPINASTGANGGATAYGGAGGTVSAIASRLVDVSATVKVSESAPGAASASGGNIYLQSLKTSGNAIRIQNSGQLLSLLDAAAPGPGGSIRIVSSGGEILVDGGRVQADRGLVEMRNSGASGRITLNNAEIRGDTVKIGALGASGQLLVGGGTINADTSLKLYGGSSNGSVRFTDDVTLGGAGTKIIAGKTVTIDNGRTVTIGGSTAAQVHTDAPNYTGSGGNGSTTGRFGGAGASTQSFGSRPGF